MSVIDVVARTTIAFCRDRFRNTRIHDLRLTNFVYQQVVRGVDRPEVIEFRRIRLALDRDDATITPTLITGQYERAELDLLESILEPGMTFIDVGANNGTYTCTAAELVGASGAVFAFEPVPANLELLHRSIELNAAFTENVTVVDNAVGAETGELRIYLDGKNSGTHSAGGNGATYTDVPMVTLDAALLERRSAVAEVDLVKIDVEGYELAVLDGARRLLRSCQPVLLCEFDRRMIERAGHSPERLAQCLSDHGDVFQIDERRRGLRRVELDEISSMENSNVLVVPLSRTRIRDRAASAASATCASR